ncbi:pyridoxamine 5'-phosphate oxidase family protein [Pedobacter sp. KR3-3]|uniref:Pyridoxamine 5'-phosphate oxidase family protein n=1 Tax=Pedobacter albus TaxID=3113905 RepID=A0ABU7IA38_9SPHI|nr:pyridoxamine 5'-phosphate oxidase family protein [Pedobacter sp. KR3-3]MEE1946355.1 pyridoxamine 5'-phosphate oxidase family protein [Pedobacter sp. KR3-3]
MLGELSKKEILDLLQNQLYGYLGCHANGETYVVPVNFIYSENALYAHSGPGKKIDMMRQNPKVCFQVGDIKNSFHWKSVVIDGQFEELHDQERQQVMQGIIQKMMPLKENTPRETSHGIDPAKHDQLIVYKIAIDTVSGRFESHNE